MTRRSIHTLALVAAGAAAAAGCAGELVPEGDTYRYVMASVDLPGDPATADMFSLDLDGTGRRPNQFGVALAGIPFDMMITTALKRSNDALLIELQTRSFDDAVASGVALRFGQVVGPPLGPPPCRGPTDCGYHLTGQGLFTVAPDAPAGPTLIAPVRANTLLTAPGNELTLQLSIDGLRPIRIPLRGARLSLTEMFEERIGKGTIAGGIPRDYVVGQFLDELQASAVAPLLESCVFTGMSCSCVGGTTGALLQAVYDANSDCAVSRAEIANQITTKRLQPDLLIDDTSVVSFGMTFVANRARF